MTTNQSCIESKQKQVFGTKEWAKYNENFISGCSHDCRYCYAKTMAMGYLGTIMISGLEKLRP